MKEGMQVQGLVITTPTAGAAAEDGDNNDKEGFDDR